MRALQDFALATGLGRTGSSARLPEQALSVKRMTRRNIVNKTNSTLDSTETRQQMWRRGGVVAYMQPMLKWSDGLMRFAEEVKDGVVMRITARNVEGWLREKIDLRRQRWSWLSLQQWRRRRQHWNSNPRLSQSKYFKTLLQNLYL